jgi:hypothetical protein
MACFPNARPQAPEDFSTRSIGNSRFPVVRPSVLGTAGETMRAITTATVLAALLCADQAAAQMDSTQMAMSLGSVLGSEKACGLKYDQRAIEMFIEKNVKPDDMGFASMLGLMTRGAAREIKDMSESQKTAHCAQIRRVALANKFIAD